MLTFIKMSSCYLLHLMGFFLSVTSNQPDICLECMRVSEWPLGSLSILLLKSYCLKYIKKPHQAMIISTACLVTTSNIYRYLICCYKKFTNLEHLYFIQAGVHFNYYYRSVRHVLAFICTVVMLCSVIFNIVIKARGLTSRKTMFNPPFFS